MDFNSIVQFVQAQPWSITLPFVGAVLVDWAVGSLDALKNGEFKREKVWQWVETTVGWKQGLAILGAVALTYLSKGSSDAWAALLPLVAVNGVAFSIVMNDIRVKLVDLFKS